MLGRFSSAEVFFLESYRERERRGENKKVTQRNLTIEKVKKRVVVRASF